MRPLSPIGRPANAGPSTASPWCGGLLAAAAAAALLSSACATATGLPEGSTTISTTPSGAQVYINGSEVCSTTPCNWNEGDGLAHRYHLQIRKEGYREIDLYLDKELRFFTGFVFAFRMPRQILLSLEAPGEPAPPAAGPPAPRTPSL